MSIKITPFMKKIGFKKTKKNVFKKCKDNFDIKMPSFVINCNIHKKRLEKFNKYCDKANLNFCREICVNGKKYNNNTILKMYNEKIIKKTDLTPIEVAIVISHINCWLKILDSGCDYGMVCEDDAEVRVDFKKNVNIVLKKLHEAHKNFDMLYLWNGNWNKTKSKLTQVLRVNDKINIKKENESFTAGTVCYIITSKFIKKVLSEIIPIRVPVDVGLGEYAKKYKCYTVEMKYNKSKNCYVSPFFRTGLWVCGGDWGTGQTTQDHKALTVDKIIKNTK